jgi:Mg-chelatase subunit ChlD
MLTAFCLPGIATAQEKGKSRHKIFGSTKKETVPDSSRQIVFLLDISNSMGQENKMQLLKRSTEELLCLLNAKDKISLMTFGNAVTLVYHTESYDGSDSLIKAISRVRSIASATNINGGIFEAYDLALKGNAKEKHVLLVTDGLFELNGYTKQLVCDNPGIILTCVIVGRGIEADKAVTYVREELMLKVITLVDEEKDVKRLTEVLVLKGGQ